MSNVKFHSEHTWVRVQGDVGIIGITDYAQKHMGKMVYVELPEEGDELTKGEEFARMESETATSELIAPVSGELIEANEALIDDPSIINESPYEEGWLVKVSLSDPRELKHLLTEEEYERVISER